jgi:hypothetical protein
MGEAYGTLVFTRKHQNEGRVMVTVKSEEDLSRFHIVPGSSGNVGIYSHHVGQKSSLAISSL